QRNARREYARELAADKADRIHDRRSLLAMISNNERNAEIDRMKAGAAAAADQARADYYSARADNVGVEAANAARDGGTLAWWNYPIPPEEARRQYGAYLD